MGDFCELFFRSSNVVGTEKQKSKKLRGLQNKKEKERLGGRVGSHASLWRGVIVIIPTCWFF